MKRVILPALVMSLICATALNVVAKPAAKPVKKAGPAKAAPCAPQAQQSSAAYNAYLGRMRDKLDKNWYVADGKNHVTLSCNVASDGSVTGLTLTSSPSDTKAEQAASDAFNASQPLEAPPGGKAVKLTLTFDSTADPHGDSTRSIGAKLDPIKEEAKSEGGGSGGSGSGTN